MMLSKEKFADVGGFDRLLPNTCRYLDLCLRLFKRGYYNVVKNDVRVYYYAILKNNAIDASQNDYIMGLLYKRHPWLCGKDPFINSNLRMLGDKLELKVEPQSVDYRSIGDMERNGGGEVEITVCNGQLRISGWSSIVFNGNEVILSRRLIITDRCNRNAVVKIISVPRLDIFEKFGQDRKHLKDGFVTIMDANSFEFNLEECSLGVMTELSNGQKCYTQLTMIDGGEEARDVQKIRSFCEGKQKIYVYGAGNYGSRCVNQLMNLEIPVEKVVVTKVENSVMSIGGVEIISVDELNDLDCKDAVGFFVATKTSYRGQIIPLLNSKGFYNIMGYPLDIY